MNLSEGSLDFLSDFPYPQISEVPQTREIKMPALSSVTLK